MMRQRIMMIMVASSVDCSPDDEKSASGKFT